MLLPVLPAEVEHRFLFRLRENISRPGCIRISRENVIQERHCLPAHIMSDEITDNLIDVMIMEISPCLCDHLLWHIHLELDRFRESVKEIHRHPRRWWSSREP